jgi:hypothetical protein
MKKLLHKTGAKLAAVVLFAVFTAAAAASFIGVVYMQESSFFDNSGYSFYDSHVCVDITYGYAKTVYFQYLPLTQQLELSEEEAFELKNWKRPFTG